MPGVGIGERRDQDQQCVGKGVENIGKEDSPESVDVDLDIQGAADQPVAPQQVNESQRLHQRGGEEGNHDDDLPYLLERNGGTAEGVGVGIGNNDSDEGGPSGYFETIDDDL